ncbi:hypothetical protein BGW36DRAFT_425598 [Talaromyces proteolyticus]|uniref:Carbohydrate esterase family 16 protein n=1 Tax=Talaromyces proteolyticus TaxID=1131652 RepID=A0AAD4Q0G4_9EURO|nr:uncharacterized protein BGW36DRAFT_425598 [Talaromyces proteolyticus]KAH8700789.1 hypothetical protein BGW36DRAFT_425598 [Talaromyces proteolyticus]
MKLTTSFPILAMTTAAALAHLRDVSPVYFFTFGDSYSMTSFDTSGVQPSASNPMGNPTLGQGTTTGGLNWIEYLTTECNKTLVLTYDLAVGGATIDNDIVSNPGYDDDVVYQVGVFDSVYKDSPSDAPWTSSDAVFGFWIGVNDAGNSYWNSDPENITSALANEYESLVEQIYTDGGRKFLFLNVPSIQESPFWESQGTTVVQELANYLTVFNGAIKNMTSNFQQKYSDATVVFYDSFTLMTAILASPTKYGYPNDTAASCYNSDGSTCVWWNSLHPGYKFHQLMAEELAPQISSFGGW